MKKISINLLKISLLLILALGVFSVTSNARDYTYEKDIYLLIGNTYKNSTDYMGLRNVTDGNNNIATISLAYDNLSRATVEIKAGTTVGTTTVSAFVDKRSGRDTYKFNVTVSKVECDTKNINIKYGDVINSTTLPVYLNNGSKRMHIESGITYSPNKCNVKAGEKLEVTITLKGKYTNNVEYKEVKKFVIPEKKVTSIEIKTLPNDCEYTVGETINKKGLSLIAKYSDGSSKVITDTSIIGSDPNVFTKVVKKVSFSFEKCHVETDKITVKAKPTDDGNGSGGGSSDSRYVANYVAMIGNEKLTKGMKVKLVGDSSWNVYTDKTLAVSKQIADAIQKGDICTIVNISGNAVEVKIGEENETVYIFWTNEKTGAQYAFEKASGNTTEKDDDETGSNSSSGLFAGLLSNLLEGVIQENRIGDLIGLFTSTGGEETSDITSTVTSLATKTLEISGSLLKGLTNSLLNK